MSIKFAKTLVKEMNKQSHIEKKRNIMTGEEFEKWLYDVSSKDIKKKKNKKSKK